MIAEASELFPVLGPVGFGPDLVSMARHVSTCAKTDSHFWHNVRRFGGLLFRVAWIGFVTSRRVVAELFHLVISFAHL